MLPPRMLRRKKRQRSLSSLIPRHVTPRPASTSRHLPSDTVKMASAETPQLRRVPAALAVFLGLLGALNTGRCDDQVPLILWTSDG